MLQRPQRDLQRLQRRINTSCNVRNVICNACNEELILVATFATKNKYMLQRLQRILNYVLQQTIILNSLNFN
jgi:hypothetical protein